LRLLLIIVILFCCRGIFSQTLRTISSYEKRWALAHPFAALKVKKIHKKCMPLYLQVKKARLLDTLINGGKLDAFRHSFFMAAFAQKIKAKKVRKLGAAHEKGNYKQFLKGKVEEGDPADSLSCAMDLLNNEVGIRIGSVNKTLSLEELKTVLVTAVKKGETVYMKRNASGKYLDCDNNIILQENYTGKWIVPKCLQSTDK